MRYLFLYFQVIHFIFLEQYNNELCACLFQTFFLNFFEKPSDLFDEPIFITVSFVIIMIHFYYY